MGKPGSWGGRTCTWGSESGRSAPCQVPQSGCAPSLVLQVSKATGWVYYQDPAGVNFICQDPCAGCWKPVTQPPSRSDPQCLSPLDSPEIPMVGDQSRGLLKVTHSAGDALCPPGVSFPPGGTGGSQETSPCAPRAWGCGNMRLLLLPF